MIKTTSAALVGTMFVLQFSIVSAQASPYVCFAPGTRQKYMDEITAHGEGTNVPLFQLLTSRWTTTATNGSGLQQGDPTTVTWSYLPDDTELTGSSREPASPSRLFAWLNSLYGNFDAWHPLFVQAFDTWSQKTGIRFVYEPNDDGIAVQITLKPPGRLGIRGDIRIGAHPIDGFKGVLAYAYPPQVGEIVFDSYDEFFDDMSNDSLALRNVVAHEVGHAIGLGHVCPSDQTKLMEPILNFAVEGPQFDDFLGAQRFYGDRHEHNDTPGSATPLGALTVGEHLGEDLLSVDGTSDVDVYGFSLTGAANAVTVTVRPAAVAPYLEGAETTTCGSDSGTPFDPATIRALGVELLDADGATLFSATAGGVGQVATLPNILLTGGEPHFVRVSGASVDDVQSYELSVQADELCEPGSCPVHDTVVRPVNPVTVRIPAGTTYVSRKLAIKVSNADVGEAAGHTVALSLDAGDCPVGVASQPDFVGKTPAAESTILIPGGQTKTAKLLLTVRADDFSGSNLKAPSRCTLWVTAAAVVPGGHAEARESNNVVPIELNVVDLNDPAEAAVHEAAVTSLKPVTVSIGKRKAAVVKRVKPGLVNADPKTEVPGDVIGAAVAAGTCPPGLLGAVTPESITVPGGAAKPVTVPVTAASVAYATPNKLSPERCIGSVSASGPGGDSFGSNNTTNLVIDVLDKNDF